jgi:6-phosphogluconolactonase
VRPGPGFGSSDARCYFDRQRIHPLDLLLPAARGSYGEVKPRLSDGHYAVLGGPSSRQPREMSSLRVHHHFLRKKSGAEPGEDLRFRPSQRFKWGIARKGHKRQKQDMNRISIAASARLLAALITLAMMSSCHSGGGDACPSQYCSQTVSLEGTLSGLVGSGLGLLNNSQLSGGFSGSMANGSQVTFGAATANTAYDLTIESQPTNPSQTCVISNGSGTAGSTDVTNIAVICTTDTPRFAYVANRGSNNISAFSIDSVTGTMTALAGSPFAAGNLPVAIAVDPTGHFAYVVNQKDATLSAFLIDRSSGALTEVSGSPFTTGLSPTSVAVANIPSGSFVYVANGGAGSLTAYAITAASGALTALTGSPYAAGNSPSSVAVDSTGGYVYVTNKADGTVSAFEILGGDTMGGLNVPAGSPFGVGYGPQSVVSPGGGIVYVANSASNTLSSFGSVGSGNTISKIGRSPYPTGTTPYSVAMNPLGSLYYVANQGSNNISGFLLNAGGVLDEIAGSPFTAGSEPSSVAVDNTGNFAYVVNTGSGTVSVYSIDATSGALTAINGSEIATGTQPSAIAISD